MNSQTKDRNKADRKAMTLIRQAKAERDAKGYRENLGYDAQNKLEAFMDTLPALQYRDRAEIIAHFYRACESI